MDERWAAVPGYEGSYEVSDQGRVRSLPRVNSVGRAVKGRILKPGIDSGGYHLYTLWSEGRGKSFRAHGLVMAVFVGPRPDGLEVRHLDGDPANPQLTNLAYGTPSENQRDKIEHGTHQQARKTHCPQGHPYEGDNLSTLLRKDGRVNRICLACKREASTRQRRAAGMKPKSPLSHCQRGHDFDSDNTYVSPDGRRQCRACIRLRRKGR